MGADSLRLQTVRNTAFNSRRLTPKVQSTASISQLDRTPASPIGILNFSPTPSLIPLVHLSAYDKPSCSAKITIGSTTGVEATDFKLHADDCDSLDRLTIDLERSNWCPSEEYASIMAAVMGIDCLDGVRDFKLEVGPSLLLAPSQHVYYSHCVLMKFSNLTTITLRGCAVPVIHCLSMLSLSLGVSCFELDSLQDVELMMDEIFFPGVYCLTLPALGSLTIHSSIDLKILWKCLFMPRLHTVTLRLDYDAAQIFDPCSSVFNWRCYEHITVEGDIKLTATEHLERVCTKPGQLNLLPHVQA